MYYTLSLVLTYYYLLLVHKRMSGQCKYVHRLFYQLPYLICVVLCIRRHSNSLRNPHNTQNWWCRYQFCVNNLFETNFDVIFVHITFNYILPTKMQNTSNIPFQNSIYQFVFGDICSILFLEKKLIPILVVKKEKYIKIYTICVETVF